MRTNARVCVWNSSALTDIDQNACGFKNLVIDILQRYVGNHILLNEVLRKDNWESGSLREHDARDFRGDVVGRERTSGREAPNSERTRRRVGQRGKGTYRSHDCVFSYTSGRRVSKDKVAGPEKVRYVSPDNNIAVLWIIVSY
jgi:hypothetical protein